MQGNTVVLTINHELQEIAERALADAVDARWAPRAATSSSSIRATARCWRWRAGAQDPRATASTALTEPYEPGSTLKPFIAATLLEKKRARETDVVDTFGGQMTINGRTITDEHEADRFTLADVIRYSSNIGIVQFATRLSPREQYEALRDFGFGTPTGVPYPVGGVGHAARAEALVEAVGRARSRWATRSP